MANNFNVGVDKCGIEEFLEVVPEKLTSKDLLELEQEQVSEEKARVKDTAEEAKEPQEKSQ